MDGNVVLGEGKEMGTYHLNNLIVAWVKALNSSAGNPLKPITYSPSNQGQFCNSRHRALLSLRGRRARWSMATCLSAVNPFSPMTRL